MMMSFRGDPTKQRGNLDDVSKSTENRLDGMQNTKRPFATQEKRYENANKSRKEGRL
jgi:hypothetical protein